MPAGTFQGSYSFDQGVLSVGGIIVSGFADGDGIVARFTNDRAFAKEGADGEVGFAINASRLGEIEINLSQTSKANDELSILVGLGIITSKPRVVPITFADLSGRSLISGSNCILKSAPEATFGREIGDRTWVFHVADLTMYLGGNN